MEMAVACLAGDELDMIMAAVLDLSERLDKLICKTESQLLHGGKDKAANMEARLSEYEDATDSVLCSGDKRVRRKSLLELIDQTRDKIDAFFASIEAADTSTYEKACDVLSSIEDGVRKAGPMCKSRLWDLESRLDDVYTGRLTHPRRTRILERKRELRACISRLASE